MNHTRGALCGGNWGTLGMDCAWVVVDVCGGACAEEGGLAAGSSAAAGEVVMRGEAVMGTSPSFPDSAPVY